MASLILCGKKSCSLVFLCRSCLAAIVVLLLLASVGFIAPGEAWVSTTRTALTSRQQRQILPTQSWPIRLVNASERENEPYRSSSSTIERDEQEVDKASPAWILSSADESVLAGSGATPTRSDPSSSLLVPEKSLSLLDVAASITQESCPLLGVKSLGVDYGLVRTGLAVTVGYEPIPLAILQGPTDGVSTWNTTNVCAGVMEYATSQQVQRIIVGLPLHKNGTIAGQTNVTLKFGAELTALALRTLGPRVPVLFFDERYTSKEAEARVHSRNPGHGRLYGTLDADAACIILENYYQDGGLGAHRLELPVDVRDECLRQFQIRHQEQERVRRQIQEERESRVHRRKEAIARALEEERIRIQSDEPTESRGRTARKKKKKRNK